MEVMSLREEDEEQEEDGFGPLGSSMPNGQPNGQSNGPKSQGFLSVMPGDSSATSSFAQPAASLKESQQRGEGASSAWKAATKPLPPPSPPPKVEPLHQSGSSTGTLNPSVSSPPVLGKEASLESISKLLEYMVTTLPRQVTSVQESVDSLRKMVEMQQQNEEPRSPNASANPNGIEYRQNSKPPQKRPSLLYMSLRNHTEADTEPKSPKGSKVRDSTSSQMSTVFSSMQRRPRTESVDETAAASSNISQAMRAPALLGAGIIDRRISTMSSASAMSMPVMMPSMQLNALSADRRISTMSAQSSYGNRQSTAPPSSPLQGGIHSEPPGIPPPINGIVEEDDDDRSVASGSSDDREEEEEADNPEKNGEQKKESAQKKEQTGLQKWSLGLAAGNKGQTRKSNVASTQHRVTVIKLEPGPMVYGFDLDHLVILPDTRQALIWYSVLLVTILLLAWLVPVELTYGSRSEISEYLAHISDAILIMDIVLGFFLGAVKHDGKIGLELGECICAYAQTWFIIDLLASWPFALSGAIGSSTYTAQRMLKLLKVLKVPSLLTRLQFERRSQVLLYAKVVIPIGLGVHFISCLWRLAQEKDFIDFGQAVPEETYPYEFYIADLYFLVMTMTTVGFGDISPSGPFGRLFVVLLMFASSVYGGFVVSITSQTLRAVFDDDMEKQVRDARAFMSKRIVPADLQRRVEYTIRQQVKQERSLSLAPKLLAKLSPSLQRQLSLELLRRVILKFPVFSCAPSSFVAQISQAHTWTHAMSGDLVVEEGQVQQELVFVMEGRLVIIRVKTDSVYSAPEHSTELNPDGGLEEGTLEAGAWFGEQSLFQACIRDYTVLTEENSELAVLLADEYRRVVQLYPALWSKHKQIAKQVQYGRWNIDEDLKYRPPEVEMRKSWSAFAFISLLGFSKKSSITPM